MEKQYNIKVAKSYLEAYNVEYKNYALIPTIVNILQTPHSEKNRCEAINELYRLAKIADNLEK